MSDKQRTLGEVRKEFDQFWLWLAGRKEWTCCLNQHATYCKAGNGNGHLLYSMFDDAPAIGIPQPLMPADEVEKP